MQQRNGYRIRSVFLLLAGYSLLCGCDPMTRTDRDFFRKLDQERSAREARMRGIRASFTQEQLIDQVRQHVSPEDAGTMDQWLQQQLESYKGQILFPKWSTARRGSNKQDVIFSFVLIDEENVTRKLQYSWAVDLLEMKVDAPVFSQEGEQSSPERALMDQQERRIRDHEKALE